MRDLAVFGGNGPDRDGLSVKMIHFYLDFRGRKPLKAALADP
jgi:hypothetical protein